MLAGSQGTPTQGGAGQPVFTPFLCGLAPERRTWPPAPAPTSLDVAAATAGALSPASLPRTAALTLEKKWPGLPVSHKTHQMHPKGWIKIAPRFLQSTKLLTRL